MSGSAAVGGAGAVVRQGQLRKLKTMKKKYFVLRAETLDSARLEYYESEKKYRAGAGAKRTVSLKSCYNITRRLDLKQKHVIALFTREEQFCVVAENEDELHEWLTDILKLHRSDDASDELLHPIQHVWQVNVQKKGLGASKNIQGLYNLCLTDKTLTLVKIKSHNNVISDLGIPERVEYSLKNIRRCGDSECFFYMEVGRQTVTGDGEIWMHSEDSNIAQSMHSTILHAMRNCAKETENDKDHIILPSRNLFVDGSNPPPARRQTYSDSTRPGLSEKGLCVGSCIKQCVCASATYSIDDSACGAPLTARTVDSQHNTLISSEERRRVIKHHRTVSLPAGCSFHEPLKIVHERTRSAPLTGDEVEATADKVLRHSSCKTVNGPDPRNGPDLFPPKNGPDLFPPKIGAELFPPKKPPWSRRASTGTRLSKLSPAHAKNAGTQRNRCDSMPSRVTTTLDIDRTPVRHSHTDFIEIGPEASRDEPDASEWLRTPRIPEEPDYYEMTPRDLLHSSRSSVAAHHSRTSSWAGEEPPGGGYMPMAPGGDLASASSSSVCSGTPSTDPRFSEYLLEPATSHIVDDSERPPRAYSVGSRPAPRSDARHRAYSVGARHHPPPAARPARAHLASASAPLLPRASADDLMELDFSANRRLAALRVPPEPAAAPTAEYVDMAPGPTPPPPPPPPPVVPARPDRDGYVEMQYAPRSTATRPIAIAAPRCAPPAAGDAPASPSPATPSTLGSQTIFPLSPESPAAGAAMGSSPPYVRIAERREGALNYARLDLEPRAPLAAASPRVYTKIDFGLSEKLHADAN